MGSGGSAQAHQPQEPQEPGQTPEVAPRIQSAGARTDANKVDPADGASPGKTPHDLAKDSDDKKVFVALLSGKDCECLWLQDRTIGQLKEEAQQKLDIAIKNLIGPSMEPLDEEKMLAEENILPGTTLTVVVVDQAAEDEKEAEECPDIFEAAYRGNVAAVRHFLRTEPSAAAAKHEILGDTPLHVAAWHGQAAICQVLLAADAEVDARDGGEDLFEGMKSRDFAEKDDQVDLPEPVFVALLSGQSCYCSPSKERTVRQLKEEAQQNLGIEIKCLIGPDMEPLDDEKTLQDENIAPGTMLTAVAVNQEAEDEKEAAECQNNVFQAAIHGKLGAVRHLLRTVPGSTAAKEGMGRSALHFAARDGHVEICRVLLAAGAEVDSRVDLDRKTPLHYAAYGGCLEVANLLLEAKASVTAEDGDGDTPLHRAVFFGKADVVKLLLEWKASVTCDGITPLDLARSEGRPEIVKILEGAEG